MTPVTEEFAGISNYKLLLETPAFMLAVQNTVRFTVTCLPLLILLSLIVTLMLMQLRRIQMIKSMLLFPLAVPTATVVLIWKMIFARQGFWNGFLMKLSTWIGMGPEFTGKTAIDYMGSSMAFWVLVFSYIWKNIGYTVVLWLAGFQGISTDMIEAAKVDGAGKIRCFWYIILPNLQGTLYTIIVLSFLNSFKVFREAYLVAGSYPDKSMYLLQHLFNNWFVNMEFHKMAAAAVLIGVILFTIILIMQMLWVDKEERVR